MPGRGEGVQPSQGLCQGVIQRILGCAMLV